jgi:hypothetical protein
MSNNEGSTDQLVAIASPYPPPSPEHETVDESLLQIELLEEDIVGLYNSDNDES